MNDIPWHQLYDRGDAGVEIVHFQPGDLYEAKDKPLGAHRDDHYIFFLFEAGKGELMIDFQVVPLTPGAIYFILPGQVHHGINAEMAYGWYLALDTSLLSAAQRQVFEERLILQQPVSLNADEQQRFREMLEPLYRHYLEQAAQPFYRAILYSFLQVFTGMMAVCRAAECFHRLPERGAETNHRPARQPLDHPGADAGSQMFTLLTNSTVKEIAFLLGYTDHTYFSRLFKEHVGQTPLAFRAAYRE